jgi:hypothetical protein
MNDSWLKNAPMSELREHAIRAKWMHLEYASMARAIDEGGLVVDYAHCVTVMESEERDYDAMLAEIRERERQGQEVMQLEPGETCIA